MANVSIWSGVGVSIGVAGVAQSITSITKANPGVATYVGTDPANGDYVTISALGMSQVDARIFRVANVSAGANTFELEAEDTTSYDVFSSGSFQPTPFTVTIGTITGLSSGGGDFEFIDITTIHDLVRKQIPGLAAAATYNFEMIWDVADAGEIAMKQASDQKGQRAVRFSFTNGQKVVFLGYVGATLLPVGNAQDKVTTPAVFTMFGRPTTYAT